MRVFDPVALVLVVLGVVIAVAAVDTASSWGRLSAAGITAGLLISPYTWAVLT
jgi:hypothetical protein